MQLSSAISILPPGYRELINNLPESFLTKIEEIRLVSDMPLIIYADGGSYFITEDGDITKNHKNGIRVSAELLKETFIRCCEGSVYSFESEIKSGFITLKGGHRVGICGSAIMDGSTVRALKDISGLNIRVAKEVFGASNKVMEHIYNEDKVHNTLIVSPPGCGKTTLLRDIARTLGSQYYKKVGIVDERGEIGATYRGIAQADVGVNTVIMNLCPKTEAVVMLLKSMGLDTIILDEVGTDEDINSLYTISNAGVSFICTTHANDYDDVREKGRIGEAINKKMFKNIIVLSRKNGVGTLEEVFKCY